MNWAHEPHEVAWSTASQAWNIAESREPPVPRPPLLMHAASAPPAAIRRPANASAGTITRLDLLRIVSLLPSTTRKTASRGTLPEIAVLHTVSFALSCGNQLIFPPPWPPGDAPPLLRGGLP